MRRPLLVPLLLLLCPALLYAQDVVKRVGSVTFSVDASRALPGGFFVVRLQSRYALGAAWALLEGRRAPFQPSARGPRAFVPIPVGTVPGAHVIGVEISARKGRQRVPLNVTVGERTYPPRLVQVPEARRALLEGVGVSHDGRRLLGLLRTQTPAMRPSLPLRPPVTAPGAGFGAAQTYEGTRPYEALVDSVFGEVHRGLDYPVPAGTPVFAPAPGNVLHAGPLLLSGQTVVIDHGQGIVSALFHLSRLDVAAGQSLEGGAAVGLSGDTGLCTAPLVQWRVYMGGVAIDPRLLDRPLD